MRSSVPEIRVGNANGCLTARQYGFFTLFFVTFAIYGSLVPFRFHQLAWSEAFRQFDEIRYYDLSIQSRSDFVANILLFIPIAFCAMGWVRVDKSGAFGTLLWAGFWLFALVGLSLAIEFAQLFFPPRTVSLNDLTAESTGALVGIFGWWVFGQPVSDWARRIWTQWGEENFVATLLPGYLAFLVLIHVMPLDLTLSPVEIYHKYKSGRIIVAPFSTGSSLDILRKCFIQFVYYAPLGTLIALLPKRFRSKVNGWFPVLLIGLASAACLEFLQLFVFTRTTDVTDVLTGAICVFLGWSLMRQLRRLPVERLGAKLAGWCLIAVQLGIIIFVQWEPFRFEWNMAFIRQQWQNMTLIPFADYYAGNDYNSFDQFLHKMLLFLPLGALLNYYWEVSAKRAVMMSAILASGIEMGQLALPGRYASLTDVMVQTFGSWIGCQLVARVRTIRENQKDFMNWKIHARPT